MKTFGDKVLHGVAFTVGAVTWIRTIQLLPRLTVNGAMGAGSAAALVVGAAIEGFQSFIPGRSADARDLASDAVGVLFALLILWIFGGWKQKPRP